MAQFDAFSFAASVTALLLAAAFLIAYGINRSLTSFRWWAASFVLLAIALATATLRFDGPSHWFKVLSWAAFYGAACLVALGLYREGATRTNPLIAIAACAVLYVCMATALVVTLAPPHFWFLLGPVPTLVFMTWSLVPILRARAWGYGIAVSAGILVIAMRALWYTTDLIRMGPVRRPPLLRGTLPPDGQPPEGIRLGLHRAGQALADFRPPSGGRAPVEQPLTIALITIAALLGLAMALALRDLLLSVQQMRQRSTTDALTGLLNRATFDESAVAMMAAPQTQPTCVVLFDIDHFKKINDTCGHPVGDRVIAQLGHILGEVSVIRSIAGRIGGEEFAVILSGADLATARLFAETIRTGFSSSDFGEDVPWTVTLSAGIALRQAEESYQAVIARADKALYAAKAQGRDRVMLADEASKRRLRFG